MAVQYLASVVETAGYLRQESSLLGQIFFRPAYPVRDRHFVSALTRQVQMGAKQYNSCRTKWLKSEAKLFSKSPLNHRCRSKFNIKKEKTPVNRDFLLATFLSKVTS